MCVDLSQPQASLISCSDPNIFKASIQHQDDGSIVLTDGAGKCLDVEGGFTAAGSRVRWWDCNGLTAQKFDYEDMMLKPRVVGDKSMCVDVQNNGVLITGCTGMDGQKWKAM